MVEKLLLIGIVVAGVNSLAVVLYELLGKLKDLTDSDLDNKLYSFLGKFLPLLQKIVGLIGAIRK
jgi:hypothetical protein